MAQAVNAQVDVPIDGRLSLLLAVGVGYGVKKVHEKRKKEDQNKMKSFLWFKFHYRTNSTEKRMYLHPFLY